ncbi:hypothetical protein EA472_10950 [Natrarchaeobius oligotrophus]|uniref:Uncharacterized protein n=1 Tax=Natrarchaeobius chitinivorans TaxID=1679083 RepID=A0A3N6NLW8_NATCH|nr:hypothetical protein EA472_10950 [Natrarchaeobius chitinivorans]
MIDEQSALGPTVRSTTVRTVRLVERFRGREKRDGRDSFCIAQLPTVASVIGSSNENVHRVVDRYTAGIDRGDDGRFGRSTVRR